MSDYLKICESSLEWARKRQYKGYSKFDALNSPLLWAISCKSAFLRKAFVFGLSRFPINIRPLLGVRRKQNPKGLALFVKAYLNLYELTRQPDFQQEAFHLLDLLLEISQKDKYSGHCWGYEHPWQNIAFFIPAYEPNSVVTCAAGEAYLKAYTISGKKDYLDVSQSVARFLLNDLKEIKVGQGMQCSSYDLHSNWKVINVNAFIAAFLAKLHQVAPKDTYKQASQAMMRWVISQKTEDSAWYYTDPPEASRITIDNYHTGFVLDSIQEYFEVFENPEYKAVWQRGLVFYRNNLFTDTHAPKWMYNRMYPNDIHGAAQGIITFSRASRNKPELLRVARKILEWTLENLYDVDQSRFYYQKSGHWTKRFTLMRWSQAWMCYAISEYMRISEKKD